MTGRSVTLAVCDTAGNLLGQTDAFDVETPWWQDMEPIGGRFPSLHVLRMLEATPAPGTMAGGVVSYLAEAAEGTRELSLRPSTVVLEDHPLRMPWARPGGPAADLAWAYGIVEPAGRPVQHRTWNLSSIWSIPTRSGTVWLKCVAGFSRHEATVLRLLDDPGTPRVLGAEGHRSLLAEMPGIDGYLATTEERRRLVDRLVDLQLHTAPRTGELLGAGVPDGRWPELVEQVASVVSRRAPEDPHLRRLLDDAGQIGEAIEACGLAEVLVHGDAHSGNARTGTEPPIWFDWGESRVGHPLLDLAVLDRLDTGEATALERYWLSVWQRSLAGSDPTRAWRLLQPFATARAAAVYQMFLDNIEPAERAYHVHDVMPALAAASKLAAGRRRLTE
jgi:hypothetical protein